MQINELAGNGLGECGVTGERYRYKSLHVGWEEKEKKEEKYRGGQSQRRGKISKRSTTKTNTGTTIPQTCLLGATSE